jgi:hypothetical protein
MEKFSKTKISFSILFFSVFISISHAQIKAETLKKENVGGIVTTLNELKGIDLKMRDKANQFHFGNPKTPNSFGIKKGLCWQFEYGNVYYNYKTEKTYAIADFILKKWGEIGWENGWLGFPITDTTYLESRSGFFVTFENGTIFYSLDNGAHFIGGAFREFWLKDKGGLGTKLGFPKTDEVVINEKGYTRYQQFEFGTLFWGPDKEVLYFPDPNKIVPYTLKKMQLNYLKMNSYASSDEAGDDNALELYGFLDISVFDGNGNEIKNSLNSNRFNQIEKNNPTKLFSEDEKNNFAILGLLGDNWHNFYQYNITTFDIENGYIRITYCLNDKDDLSSDDYFQLQGENGRWNYKNGNFKYRDIKLMEIYNQVTTNKTDLLKETSQFINVKYSFTIADFTR